MGHYSVETLRSVAYDFVIITVKSWCITAIIVANCFVLMFSQRRSLMVNNASCVHGTSTRLHWQKGKDCIKLWMIPQPNLWEHTGAPKVSNREFTGSPRSMEMYMWLWTCLTRTLTQMSIKLRDTELCSRTNDSPSVNNQTQVLSLFILFYFLLLKKKKKEICRHIVTCFLQAPKKLVSKLRDLNKCYLYNSNTNFRW